MATTSTENDTTSTAATTPVVPVTYTAWADLKSDGKSIANQSGMQHYCILHICMIWTVCYSILVILISQLQ